MTLYTTLTRQLCLRWRRMLFSLFLGMFFIFAISKNEKYHSNGPYYIAQETTWKDQYESNHGNTSKSISNVHNRDIKVEENIMISKKNIHKPRTLKKEKEKISIAKAKNIEKKSRENHNKNLNKNKKKKNASRRKYSGGLHEDKNKKLFCTIPESLPPVLESRRNHATAACERLKVQLPLRWRLPKSPSPSMLTKLRWDRNHHLIYCNIPKAASTTWSWHLLRAVGVKDDVIASVDNAHILMKEYLPYPETDDVKTDILDSALKFLVTRHPFERLVSAYKNKIADPLIKRHKYQNIQKELIAQYYGELPKEDQPKVPSFRDFCRYVIKEVETWLEHDAQGGKYQPDQHWTPQTFICSPCNIQYDIFSDMSTMNSDAEYIGKQCGLEDVIKTTIQLNPSTGSLFNQSKASTANSTLVDRDSQSFSVNVQHQMETNENRSSEKVQEYENNSNHAMDIKITQHQRDMNSSLIDGNPNNMDKQIVINLTEPLNKPLKNINYYENYFLELSELEIK
ncbi:unnamed protein product, partial [Meganyctiphanes norvegica]